MPTEITELRGPRSRVLLLDDGVTKRLEVGGDIAHHQKDGVFVVTDTRFYDLTDRFGTGEYPYSIGFNKQTRTLAIVFPEDTITLTPTNLVKKPTFALNADGSITLGLWTGITLTARLMPDGLSLSYVKTATTFTNPTYATTGDVAKYLGAESYVGTDGVPTTVPFSLVNGVYTLNMSDVPIGSLVR